MIFLRSFLTSTVEVKGVLVREGIVTVITYY